MPQYAYDHGARRFLCDGERMDVDEVLDLLNNPEGGVRASTADKELAEARALIDANHEQIKLAEGDVQALTARVTAAEDLAEKQHEALVETEACLEEFIAAGFTSSKFREAIAKVREAVAISSGLPAIGANSAVACRNREKSMRDALTRLVAEIAKLPAGTPFDPAALKNARYALRTSGTGILRSGGNGDGAALREEAEQAALLDFALGWAARIDDYQWDIALELDDPEQLAEDLAKCGLLRRVDGKVTGENIESIDHIGGRDPKLGDQFYNFKLTDRAKDLVAERKKVIAAEKAEKEGV